MHRARRASSSTRSIRPFWGQARNRVKKLLSVVVGEIRVGRRSSIRPCFVRPGFVCLHPSGGGRESNPPGEGHPAHRF